MREIGKELEKIVQFCRKNFVLQLLLILSFLFAAAAGYFFGRGDEGIFLLFLAAASIVFYLTVKLHLTQKKYLAHQQKFLEEIYQNLQNLEKAFKAIKENDFSEEYDFNQEISEFSNLYENLKAAGEKFKLINLQNQRISFELVKSIQNLAEVGNIQASASSQQASSIAEITATMEELARTAAQIAENSNKVAQLAENSDQASKEGFTLVNNVIQSIENIDEKMHHISEKTQILGQQSKQIEKVLEIIYDIANETHLLALNAAIESVAAGEYGKRFGVIASEVRRLAESARENAESIKTTIEQFQQAIDATILAIEDGSKMTSTVNKTAQEIIRHLEKIVQATAFTSQNSSEISIATQQQKTASDQIVLTLKDISQVTKQQAQELKRSSRELENINSLALKLQLLS